MSKLMGFVFFLTLFACSIDRTVVEVTEQEKEQLLHFQQLPNTSKLKIAPESEPGEQLMLCLTFVEKENKNTLPGQRVHFYHTSVKGDYELSDPNDESSARLSGQSVTNEKGQIYIETILPGDYGSSADNRHIHTTVFGAKPEAYDIFFKQYSGRIGWYLNSGNDQMFLADLKKTKENTLVSFLTIEVKRPNHQE